MFLRPFFLFPDFNAEPAVVETNKSKTHREENLRPLRAPPLQNAQTTPTCLKIHLEKDETVTREPSKTTLLEIDFIKCTQEKAQVKIFKAPSPAPSTFFFWHHPRKIRKEKYKNNRFSIIASLSGENRKIFEFCRRRYKMCIFKQDRPFCFYYVNLFLFWHFDLTDELKIISSLWQKRKDQRERAQNSFLFAFWKFSRKKTNFFNLRCCQISKIIIFFLSVIESAANIFI